MVGRGHNGLTVHTIKFCMFVFRALEVIYFLKRDIYALVNLYRCRLSLSVLHLIVSFGLKSYLRVRKLFREEICLNFCALVFSVFYSEVIICGYFIMVYSKLKVFKKRKNVGIPIQGQVVGSHGECSSINNNQFAPPPSSSQKKLKGLEGYSVYEEECSETDVNHIFNLNILCDVFLNYTQCKECGKNGLKLEADRTVGLATLFRLYCDNCEFSKIFCSSYERHNEDRPSPKSKFYDINVRLVYALRAIGKGAAAASALCGIMNLPPPPQKFGKYNEFIGNIAEDVAIESMKNAIEEAVVENNNIRDLSVALDGSWQKRGHTSMNGVVTATSVDTGKVIGVAVMSKYCRCPNKKEHSENCTANYSGNSGGMEVAGVVKIFQQSEPCDKVRYINYLGDGDSKAYKAINELKPYGENVPITKLECIGHVQKRMGTRLRRLKTSYKGKKLQDGKSLDGKNRLTEAVIDQIQNYYGMAIRQNVNSAENMRKAVWAVLFHISSSDDKPNHGLCPEGRNSWCKYNKAKATGEQFTHKRPLPHAIVEVIKDVFRDLSDIQLLKKCLHGRTQNPNESINSVIWTRIPKTVFVSINTLHFGVYDAVATFNDGNIARCEVLKRLLTNVGFFTIKSLLILDKERLRASEKAVKDIESRARQHRRAAKRKLQDEDEEDADNPSYGAGMH